MLYNQLPQTKQLENNTHLVSHSSVCQCPHHGLTGFSAQDIISLKSSCWLYWVLVWRLWGKILLQAHSVFVCMCVCMEVQSLNHWMAREVPRQWCIIVLQRKKILDKWEFIIYSWPLNDMSLNCVGPLTCGFFSIVITTVLHDLWLVDSEGTKPRTWRNQVDKKLTISYMQIFNWVEDQCP